MLTKREAEVLTLNILNDILTNAANKTGSDLYGMLLDEVHNRIGKITPRKTVTVVNMMGYTVQADSSPCAGCGEQSNFFARERLFCSRDCMDSFIENEI